ncbi:MAG: adenylyltransferase/cytidyltransferase family protein [Bacteroidota bacterium]
MDNKPKRIMVDMSATLLHHGHVRLLKKAKKIGHVVVALTSDNELKTTKGYKPELNFEQRKEILESLKYVDEVVQSNWLITEDFLDKHRIDFLVHGSDNTNKIKSERLIIFPRTKGISSNILRGRILKTSSQILLLNEKS